MNFAKRLCADDASLIEVVDIKIDKDDQQNKIINDILKENRFSAMYRKQIEEMSACGTVGAYIRIEDAKLYDNGDIKGGNIKINYCNAENIVPLTVINNEILECAFCGTTRIKGKEKAMAVIFCLKNGTYTSVNVTYDENDVLEEETTFPFGNVKPFAIMRVAEVNNLNMVGYGYPKLWNAIPNLKIIDLSYTMWKRDLEKSDKIVMMNEALCNKDKEGNILQPTNEMKKLFVQMGTDAKLPQEKSLWQEYNPTVRVDEVTKSFELALSLLSMCFGFGTRRYTFENGRILTATEYAGERQDSMQEINKQRSECIDYISDLVKAIRWFYNSIQGTKLSDQEITIDFDDSYIEDKKSKLEMMRNDSLAFEEPYFKINYAMAMYGLTEKEAKAMFEQADIEDEDKTSLEGNT